MMGSLWENRSTNIHKQEHGENDYEERRSKAIKECRSAIDHSAAAGKLKLGMELSKMKKLAGERTLQRHHAVGAVGYADVLGDDRLPENDFFEPGRKFRIRFRHSNVGAGDDASSCCREAAIKFCDQNVDGPLDLILVTGRVSLARNVHTLHKVLKLKYPDDVRKLCRSDPLYYYALVDGLRRAPTSFAELTYHSQFAYQLTCRDGRQVAVRFRLSPRRTRDGGDVESGLLDPAEQREPWASTRRPDDKRPEDYLRREFIGRLQQDDPVTYYLQVQVNAGVADATVWNPQLAWDERQYPWIDLALVQLTTFMPHVALKRTYFNIVEKPKCLQFPAANCPLDPRSVQQAWSDVLTEFENNDRLCQLAADEAQRSDSLAVARGRRYLVTLCTAPFKTGGTVPRVEVYITLAGTHCRSTPQQLLQYADKQQVDDAWFDDWNLSRCQSVEHFVLETMEQVGEILAVIVSIRHRSLTDQWYIEQVLVTSNHRDDLNRTIQCFPCHQVVLSRVTLLAGQVSTAERQQFELHRQERQCELCERRHQYQWAATNSKTDIQPGQIRATGIKDLPEMDKQRAAKYTGLRWDIDPVIIEYFRYILFDFIVAAQPTKQAASAASSSSRATNPRQSVSSRQRDSASAVLANARSRTMLRHFSIQTAPIDIKDIEEATPAAPPNSAPPIPVSSRIKAKQNWRKVKNTLSFVNSVSKPSALIHLPEGAKGDMCRAVQRDVDFGKLFLTGPNPMMIRRCTEIPANFPVTDDMLAGLLSRSGRLRDEVKNGWVYMADYHLLQDIPTIHRDADHRYVAAPLVLLYVRPNGLLVPLAIQLMQTPGPDNPIWTPNERRPENWMLAKLWVQHADFEFYFAISHLFRCHWLMEPFAISTMRQLSSAHPVYKLLKPHFRYTLVTNTLLRHNVLQPKSGHVDRFHSIGPDGIKTLTSLYWNSDEFSFSDLDPEIELARRGVDDARQLPMFPYRDQGVKLWKCIRNCVARILGLFYHSDEDVLTDTELQSWLRELREVGFGGHPSAARELAVGTVNELSHLVARLVFTLTAQHSATHFDALDLYGFLPDVPAMMRRPPPDKRDFVVTRDVLSATLPDQFPDAYFVALAYVVQVHRPDENVIGTSTEVYFVEKEAREIIDEYRQQLNELTFMSKVSSRGDQYESLTPSLIPASAEPVPYIPREAVKEAVLHGPKLPREEFMRAMASRTMAVVPTVDLFTLPVCLHFACTLGGRSFIGRRLAAEASPTQQKIWQQTRNRRSASVSDEAPATTLSARTNRLQSSCI